MSEESPLDALTREEFMEIFNSKARFHVNTPGEQLIARRQKLMRFIAKFRTEVHAIDEVANERRRSGTAKERAALKEADKKYVRKRTLEDSGVKESTGDKILDALIKSLGSKEAAVNYLKKLQEKNKGNGAEK